MGCGFPVPLHFLVKGGRESPCFSKETAPTKNSLEASENKIPKTFLFKRNLKMSSAHTERGKIHIATKRKAALENRFST